MDSLDRKLHWENIYQTKALENVSWYQPRPITSLNFIEKLNIPLNAKIIDIGGGDSFLVDHLLDLGYTDITVLDISAAAIDRAQKRLADRAELVKWIIADISSFKPTEHYDFWHDRAAFHFLTQEHEIRSYVQTLNTCLKPNAKVVIGTFSEQGPLKCSGIEIKQYSETAMAELFQNDFEKLECINVDHPTPFNTVQNFTFCSFRKFN